MRHGKKIHKLERPRAHRQALVSNLATALITHGKIRTTEAKAKALKPVIDRLIATAKTNTVHARRLAGRTIKSRDILKRLFDEIAPKMVNRSSGYSRMMRVGTRRGDGAQIVLIELMSVEHETQEKGKKGRKGWRKFGRRPKADKEPQPKAAPAPAEEEKTRTAIEDAASEERPVDTEAESSEDLSQSPDEEPSEKDAADDKETDSEKKRPE